MSNLELRIEEEANLGLTISDSSDMSFDAVDFVGVPFAPTVEVEDIEGGHRVSITSMGAEGKKTDEFDVMDGADGATGPQGPKGDSYEITAADYAEIAEVVEGDIQDVIDAAQDAADDATAAAAEARAASAATWLNGNVLFGELAEGTVLTTDDAYAAPPKGVEVFGKSTQVTTTGKNLLNLARSEVINTNAKGGAYDRTTPRDFAENQIWVGITMNGYFNPANITAYNVTSDSVTLTCIQSGYGIGFPVKVTPNTTYSVQSDRAANEIAAGYFDSNGLNLSWSTPVSKGQITTPSDCQWAVVVFRPDANTSATFAHPQLELGSTATSYEPYTGGKPAPSPDYPQEIKSVDDLTLHVANATKRAYFNQMRAPQDGTASGTYNGVSYVRNADGSIDIGGTATAQVLIYPYVFPVGEIVFGHKYLIRGTSPMGGSWETYYGSMGGVGGFDYGNGSIYTNVNYNSGTSTQMRITVKEGATIPQTKLWPQLFDLTLMFGEGNEPATVAEFEEMFPDTYYPYNDGTWNDAPNWPITIPLGNHIARSLPDGTRDTVTLTYQGPSTREGWGVFSKTLVQRVGYRVFTACTGMASNYRGILAPNGTAVGPATYGEFGNAYSSIGMSSINLITYDNYGVAIHLNGSILCKVQGKTTANELNAWLADNPISLAYQLPTPITTDLGTVELPILPNPLTAWADGGSAQPTLALEYERALNIVIPRIEAQLADMATS